MDRMALFALAGGIPALGMAFVLWMAGVVSGQGLEVGQAACHEAGPGRPRSAPADHAVRIGHP